MLKSRIEEDFKRAALAKEMETVAALRLIKSAIKYKEIENRGPLEESQVVEVLSTLAKQRRESIEQFQKGGRDDLVQKEKKELILIEKYLPKGLSEEEVAALIDEAIQNTKANGLKDIGQVMKYLMSKTKGRFDGKKMSELVQAKLKTIS